MKCTLQKAYVHMGNDEDGRDIWDRSNEYQDFRQHVIHERLAIGHKHAATFPPKLQQDYHFCEGKYHVAHYGAGHGRKSYGEAIVGLCPDWADRNPAQAELSVFRGQVSSAWDRLLIAHADQSQFNAAKAFYASDLKTFIISGPCGYGKTTLAKAIQNDFTRRDASTFFITCEDLIELYIIAQARAGEMDLDARQKVQDMARADLVVLDDLGTAEREYTESFKEKFKSFLDKHDGRLVVTTNLSRHELEQKLNDKIVSRLFSKSQAITLRGRDYRRTA